MKKQLKELYAHYKSIKREDYDDRDEFRADYKEAYADLTKAMEVHGIADEYDLLKVIYTPNQLQFIEDAESECLEVDYTYSGRCMYGDTCPAVRVDSHNDLKTKANTSIDGMGLGIVIYANN
jgi:hypothetical protein